MTQELERLENLGPAEHILNTLLQHSDHIVHNRPGLVSPDPNSPTGIKWVPVTHKEVEGEKIVFQMVKKGKRSSRVRLGVMGEDGKVRHQGRVLGRYQKPGLVHENVAWLYDQVAQVYQLDNDFAARWASWAFAQEHRDLKVVLAALMLVQTRCGAPVKEGDQVLFFDEDFRDIGEAMCLLRRKDGRGLNPKLLLRVGDVLRVPAVAQRNREMGFGRSGRHAPMGRWPKAVTRWLSHRERNVRLLQGLVKAGFRRTVMRLAQRVGYKPSSERFFEILRWRQKQSSDGRRSLALGKTFASEPGWKDLDEAQICERILKERPGFKRLVGMLPAELGLTRAIMAAAIEARSVSNQDLVILTPTLEELGLLEIEEIKARWQIAVNAAENQRAANIATRIKNKDIAQNLQDASDRAVQKAVEEVTRGLRIYVIVDKSGSMEGAIERAKACLSRFLQGFPLDRTHVSIFNTTGREVCIQHASAAGVEQAFRGHKAGGGTNYGAGVKALAQHKPQADEDSLFFFVGDQQASNFAAEVRKSGLRPVAFAMLHVKSPWGGQGSCVEGTAKELGIPCFRVDEATFEDPYAVTRTLRHLIGSTPVGASLNPRKCLVEIILETEHLGKPMWAA